MKTFYDPELSLKDHVDKIYREAFEKHGFNRTHVARALKVSIRTVRNWVQKQLIPVPYPDVSPYKFTKKEYERPRCKLGCGRFINKNRRTAKYEGVCYVCCFKLDQEYKRDLAKLRRENKEKEIDVSVPSEKNFYRCSDCGRSMSENNGLCNPCLEWLTKRRENLKHEGIE